MKSLTRPALDILRKRMDDDAGAGKWCFAAVCSVAGAYALGIVTEGEHGYEPVPLQLACFQDMDSAWDHAEKLNVQELELSVERQAAIITSSMMNGSGSREH